MQLRCDRKNDFDEEIQLLYELKNNKSKIHESI